jgi:hypothetical protein
LGLRRAVASLCRVAALAGLLLAPPPLSANSFTSHLPRREVTPEEQRTPPFNGVLKLIGRYDRGGGRPADLDCSAPIVSDHLIVANIHCVMTDDGRYVTALSAFAGFHGRTYAREFVPDLLWQGVMSRQNAIADDVAILAVREGLPAPLARFTPDASRTAQIFDTFEFLCFSRDIGAGRVLTYAHECRNHVELGSSWPDFDVIECDFMQNASAAPLFYTKHEPGGEPQYRLVAIVEGGASRARSDVPFTARTANLAIPAARFAATVAELERALVAGTAQRPLATFASILAKPR